MKWLVLGGAGFIGANLIKRLVEYKHEVTVVDNLSTGNINNLVGLSVYFYEMDIVNPRFIDEFNHFQYQPDVVVNLACPASPPAYQADPLGTLNTCFIGTQSALGIAYLSNARYLHASTSEIYGDPLQHPQKESYWGNVNTWGPRSCYDEGKRVAEALCYEYMKIGTDVRVARIFNTYGPRMQPDDGRVVSNFINQALQGQDLTIYGDGSQTRSFCYVSDLIDGLLTLAHLPEPPAHPVNLGNPTEFTVRQLADLVLSLTESDCRVVSNPLPKDDPTQRKPDISLAKSFGWEPKVPLAEGLGLTINYFKALIDEQNSQSNSSGG